MESLTQKVLRWQQTGQGLEEIVAAIAPRVYHFPRRTMGWDEDACGDFYVFVHSRMLRLVARFQDQGKPFESYLWAVLGWQLRNFARERRDRERAWRVSLRVGYAEEERSRAPAVDADPCDEAPGTSALRNPVLLRSLSTDADRRHLLFLLLKCCRLLDPADAGPLAAAAGVSVRYLLDTASALRPMRQARERRLDIFRCRRNRSYTAVQLLEAECASETDPERLAALQARLERARRCMHSSSRRMARVGVSPTNREIALVLGIPKGTVDSGLYWLKRKLAEVYDPDTLRSA
jgi:RNA polymerase sigma factor (sigma-70 family)